ncbi:lytic transglycosylase domain-containing protein [Nocardioides sp. CER19]|uniref:aggregation-promoting factor C-terminal-like domain-containing protein n=1 Tax=Nocardioides sp. CER19 TaxID=3038538 RepID=UPI00244884EF|nr:lytic transglycosylase domain-containing protein [Nocardioides sp. CER19]MDH2414929.1 lytic transglycosylase domain-containing protein [Nocardioides sp. CER19]
MSKHAAPRHRKASERSVLDAPRKAVRTTVVLGGLAAAATGTVVAGGLTIGGGDSSLAAANVSGPTQHTADPATSSTSTPTAAAPVRRQVSVSRSSDRRAAADPAKAAALAAAAPSRVQAFAKTEDAAAGDPKAIASALLGDFGWDSSQMSCLDSLWTKESGWNVHADNASSSAYGIPQALPGSKMASAGPDWQNNPVTQIKWGLGYIQSRYGTPCNAWGHSESSNWY